MPEPHPQAYVAANDNITSTSRQYELKKVLGVAFGIALVVGNVIGAGILMILVSAALFVGFALGDFANFVVIAVIVMLSWPAFVLVRRKKRTQR